MADENSSSSSNTSVVELPETLILHILSLLPSTQDAIKACSSLHQWRYLWSSIPSLLFSQHLFSAYRSCLSTHQSFSDFVDQTLLHRPPHSPPLLSFRLSFSFDDLRFVSQIDSWIRYALRNGVRVLDLDFTKTIDVENYDLARIIGTHVDYDFPFYALRDGVVRVLKLNYCKIGSTVFGCGDELRFCSLRSVVFDRVRLSDEIISRLMVVCVNLEDFDLRSVNGVTHLKIHSSSLKKLSISHLTFYYVDSIAYDHGSIEIVAPQLCSLDLFCVHVKEYVILETGSLVKVDLYLLDDLEYTCWSNLVTPTLLNNVKQLHIINVWFKVLVTTPSHSWGGIVFDNLICLKMITHYTVSDVLGIAALLELCPNLNTLILHKWSSSRRDKEESLQEEHVKKPIRLNLPNVRLVEMKGFFGTDNELEFIRLLGEGDQAPVLEKVVVVPKVSVEQVSLDSLNDLKKTKNYIHVVFEKRRRY